MIAVATNKNHWVQVADREMPQMGQQREEGREAVAERRFLKSAQITKRPNGRKNKNRFFGAFSMFLALLCPDYNLSTTLVYPGFTSSEWRFAVPYFLLLSSLFPSFLFYIW